VYRSFEVERFRGLQRVRLEDMTRVNLVTGLNDAGKTSLLEAFYLHACGPLAGAQAATTIKALRGQPLDLSQGESDPWESLFYRMDMSHPIRFSATTDVGDYELLLAQDPANAKPVGAQLAPTLDIGQVIRSTLSIHERSIARNLDQEYVQSYSITQSAPSGSAFQTMSVKGELEPNATQPFMAGAFVRPGHRGDLATLYSRARRKQSGRMDVLAALREVDPRIKGLEVLVGEGGPQLFARLEEDVLIPFQLVGDGAGAMAGYLLSMLEAKNGVLLLDEVGSGLHHSLLPAMWRILHRAAESQSVQIIASTHSAECIEAASVALERNLSELTLYRIRRDDDDAPLSVASYGDDKLGAALEMNADLR
jgi:hypothetical protein